jgi:hypothetical protein
MTNPISLKAGDTVRLATWVRFPYDESTALVGTARAYAAKYGEDQQAAHDRALSFGHDTAYASQFGSILVDCRVAAARMAAERKADFARAVTLSPGDVVEIEGETFTVAVPWGNTHKPINSDPIHFKRSR